MKTLVNGIALFGANALTSLAQYAILVLIARKLGPTSFGQYAFAYAYAALFATLCNFGLDRIVIRDAVRTRDRVSVQFASAGALRVGFGVTAVLLAQAIAVALGYAFELQLTILGLLVSLILGLFSELVRSLLYAEGAMPIEAVLRGVGRAWALGGVAVAIATGRGLAWVAASLAAAAVVEFACYLWVAARRSLVRAARPSSAVARRLAVDAWPLALNTFLVVLYFRTGLLAIARVGGDEAAGQFNAAFTFLQVLQIVGGTMSAVLLPRFLRQQAVGAEHLARSVRAVAYYLLLLVAPVCVGLSLMAGDCVAAVYGSRYAAAVPVLQVIGWASIGMFMGCLYGTFLIVLDAQRGLLWASVVAVGVSLAANLLLVPRLGSVGAAWATVITESTVAALTFSMARARLAGIGPGRSALKPLAVGAVLVVALVLMPDAGFVQRLASLTGVFVASVLLLRAVRSDDWRMILQTWRARASAPR